jgi:hypothetical protein
VCSRWRLVRLNQLEEAAKTTVTKQLHAFESPFRDAYEAGVIIPVLRNEGTATIDVRPAALFFKRALNDLRGVWLLLTTGYRSQAASVAASLFESALATICLLQSNTTLPTFSLILTERFRGASLRWQKWWSKGKERNFREKNSRIHGESPLRALLVALSGKTFQSSLGNT